MPKKVILIFGISLAVIAVLFMFVFSGGESSEVPNPFSKNKQVASANTYRDWEKEYEFNITHARGLSLFDELLRFQTKKTSVLLKNELDSLTGNPDNNTYMFVGKDFYLTDEEFDTLIARVEQGATLFISFENLSQNIYDYLFEDGCFLWDYSAEEVIEAKNKYKLSHVFQGDTLARQWSFFDSEATMGHLDPKIGYIEYWSTIKGRPNFMDAEIGEGHLYLHSNPFVFQNYQLLSKDGFNHAKGLTTFFPEEQNIYWLELARFEKTNEIIIDGDSEFDGEEDDSLLTLIYDNKALFTAFILTIIGVLLFLVFRTKRSLQVIPYLPKKENQSLTFAETIKEIYYKQQTPYNILQVMRKNFYVAVSKHFFIELNKTEKEHEVKILAEKSGIDLQKIKDLLALLETKVQSQVDFKYIEKASSKQQAFYNDSGIIKTKLKHRIESKTVLIHRQLLLPMLFIGFGLTTILTGFYLLHISEGIGTLLWPVGILLAAFGIRWYQLPLLKIEEQHLVFYPLFSRKKRVLKEDISLVFEQGNEVCFETESYGRINLSRADMSRYDYKRFEQFIFPLIHNTI